MTRTHWEDTWLPRLWPAVTDPEYEVETKLRAPLFNACRLSHETPNHRIARAGLAYAVGGTGEILLEILEEHREDFMPGELCSPTYSPFYEQPIAAALVVAHRRGDEEMVRACRHWWRSWRAIMAWQAVPPLGVPRERNRGKPLLVAWDPVPVSLRANRPVNAAAGHQLRQLCAIETLQDERVIDRSGGDINLQQLALVALAISEGALETRPLDLKAMEADLPRLAHPVRVRRWQDGFEAWAETLEGLGPAQLSVRVERGEMRLERTFKTGRPRVWVAGLEFERGREVTVIGGGGGLLAPRRV